MNLFSSLFPKKTHTVALIDISSSSVGAAYAQYVEGALPSLYYSLRMPVELRDGEELLAAALRALDALGERMVEEGGPALRRELGNAYIDRLFVSVGAPWQESEVRNESIQREHPFTFTKSLLHETIEKDSRTPHDRLQTGESVVATILNGYEMLNPWGKRVKRADLVILSSSIDRRAADLITTSLRRAFHAHDIEMTAFAPAAYAVFRDLYPHQKDFLVLEVSGMATDAAFVKHGLLVGVRSIPHGLSELLSAAGTAARSSIGTKDALQERTRSFVEQGRNAHFGQKVTGIEQEWIEHLKRVFSDFATRHALPRTLFLITSPDARAFLKHLMNADALKNLWLSDEPLTLVAVEPHQFSLYVKTRGSTEGDLYLSLLALFYGKRFKALPEAADEQPAPKSLSTGVPEPLVKRD